MKWKTFQKRIVRDVSVYLSKIPMFSTYRSGALDRDNGDIGATVSRVDSVSSKSTGLGSVFFRMGASVNKNRDHFITIHFDDRS